MGDNRKDHDRVLAPLGFVDGYGIGQDDLIEIRLVIRDPSPIEFDGHLSFLRIDL